MSRVAEGWEGWDAYAPFYDWENSQTMGRRDVRFWEGLAKRVQGPVLELGCGTGRLALPVGRVAERLVGIDRSTPMLVKARGRVRRARLTSRVHLVRGDIRHLPFPRPSPFRLVMAPYGMLQSLLREPDLTVTQASANVGDHLGARVEDVLGASLSDLLAPRSVGAVRSALDVGSWEEVNPLRIEASGRAFDGILHRHEGATILELEPADTPTARPGVHHPLRRALIAARSARTLLELCECVAREVRRDRRKRDKPL